MSEKIANNNQLAVDNCRGSIAQALSLMKMGRRLDAQDLLEASITQLENLGIVDDYIQIKSLLADLMDDMGYYEDAAKRRGDCIELAASKFGKTSRVRAELLLKQVETLFALIDKSDENKKVVEYSLKLSKLVQETMELIKLIPEYCEREDIQRDLEQKLIFCQLLADRIQKTEEALQKLKRV